MTLEELRRRDVEQRHITPSVLDPLGQRDRQASVELGAGAAPGRRRRRARSRSVRRARRRVGRPRPAGRRGRRLSGTNGPSMSAARIRSWRSDRLPAAAVCSAAAAMTTIATGIPSARLIAARAAPERAWYRPRSRSASRGATGNRDADPASARIATGLRSSTPRTTARVPARMSSAFVQSSDVSSATPPASPGRRRPRRRSSAATAAERCAGVGRGGRPDSANTVGMRAIVRAGHHAAPVAASTASAMPADDQPPRHVERVDPVTGRGLDPWHDGDPTGHAEDRPEDGGNRTGHGPAGHHHESQVPLGRPDRGEHPQLAEAALGDHDEAGRGDTSGRGTTQPRRRRARSRRRTRPRRHPLSRR